MIPWTGHAVRGARIRQKSTGSLPKQAGTSCHALTRGVHGLRAGRVSLMNVQSLNHSGEDLGGEATRTDANRPQRPNQLLLDGLGGVLGDGDDELGAVSDVRAILDRTTREADAVRADVEARHTFVRRALDALTQRVAEIDQRLVTVLGAHQSTRDANLARSTEENRRLGQQVIELQAELHRKQVLGPFVNSMAAALRETEALVHGAEQNLAVTVESTRVRALRLIIASLGTVVARLETGLGQYGMVRIKVCRGDRFDPAQHQSHDCVPTPSPRAAGTVAKVVADGWVEKKTGWVPCPATVAVYSAGAGSSNRKE